MVECNLELRRSPIQGHGVFATAPIAAREIVHHMAGEIISAPQCIYRVLSGQLRIDDPLHISDTSYIVLDPISVSFNHSCDPNALISRVATMIARRDIAVGEEITFDYAATVKRSFYTTIWSMRCLCRSPSCRGRITDIRSLQAATLRDYISVGGLQDYILEYLSLKG
jgi:uncharacterized protein